MENNFENNLKTRHLNSLFKWYPLIKDVVPTPKTVIVPLEGEFESIDAALSAAYIGEVTDPTMKQLVDQADQAAQSVGGYPVFLRSDETSHKHQWTNTCYVTSKQSLAKGVANIYEFTLMADILNFRGVAIREFLELPHEFKAFKGMPVSQEFRFFIRNGMVLCRHPYWPLSAIRRADCEDWLPKLRKLMVLDSDTQELLDELALKVSKAVESLGAPQNFWSVDFCVSKKYGWVVTDLALGADSYHWATCQHADPYMLKAYGDPEDIKEATSLMAERKKIAQHKADFEALLASLGKSEEIHYTTEEIMQTPGYCRTRYERAISKLKAALKEKNQQIERVEEFLDMLYNDGGLSKLFRADLAKARCSLCSIRYVCSTVDSPDECLRVVEGVLSKGVASQ